MRPLLRAHHVDAPSYCQGENRYVVTLRQVVDSFNSSTKNPAILAVMARGFPEPFIEGAAEVLDSEDESDGYRYLALLLSRQESVLEFMTNPGRISLNKAVNLFRRMWIADPTLDFRLARLLPRGAGHTHEKVLKGVHAVRAIDILDQVSTGQKLMSVMGRLPYCGDARIASRAVLFIGRRVSRPNWIKNQLTQNDSRLRANVVESTWGATSEAAIALLEECCGDQDNRVAGNALLGLHMAGCPDAGLRILDQSLSDQPERRTTAAWVMGKTGSGEFIVRLTELTQDADPKVRWVALRSLGEVNRAEKERRAAKMIVTPDAPEPAALEEIVVKAGDAPVQLVGFAPKLDGKFTTGKS